MARPPSVAAHDFARRLQALGIQATPQRVQTLTEIGLLPAPTPRFPGGGGSSGRYPPTSVERAREALTLADQHHRELHFAVAIMYARGQYSISESKLRRALVRVLNRYRRQLAAAAGDERHDKPPSEAAIEAGVVLAKRIERDPEFRALRRRIARSKTRPKRAVLETIARWLVQAQLTGEAPPREAIEETLRITGAHEVLGHNVASELADQVKPEHFSSLRLDDLISAVKQADLAQLERARDDALWQGR